MIKNEFFINIIELDKCHHWHNYVSSRTAISIKILQIQCKSNTDAHTKECKVNLMKLITQMEIAERRKKTAWNRKFPIEKKCTHTHGQFFFHSEMEKSSIFLYNSQWWSNS